MVVVGWIVLYPLWEPVVATGYELVKQFNTPLDTTIIRIETSYLQAEKQMLDSRLARLQRRAKLNLPFVEAVTALESSARMSDLKINHIRPDAAMAQAVEGEYSFVPVEMQVCGNFNSLVAWLHDREREPQVQITKFQLKAATVEGANQAELDLVFLLRSLR
ncbi:MAG: hypothetical protein CL946_12820 [Ectothiorhodospiraceae bacterium]|nr:hypothetical protein [Ectothiorhodospiraceae bacterium]